jgi:hypothetical protein
LEDKTIRRTVAKVTLAAALVLAGMSGMASRSMAADDNQISRPLRLQAGVFTPYKGDFRNLTQSQQFDAGLTWDFQEATPKNSKHPVRLAVFSDYSTVTKSGNQVSREGIGLQGRFYLAPLTASATPYIGIGAGFYNIHTGASASPSRNSTEPAARLSVGVDTNTGWFVDASFTSINSTSFANTGKSLDPSGYSFDLGFKF